MYLPSLNLFIGGRRTAGRAGRQPLSGQGILPCTPCGGYPAPGDPGTPGGNRGAPPRGVDVKPLPGGSFGTPKKPFLGSWTPFPPQNGVPEGSLSRRKPPEPRKMAIIPHFGVFLPILGSRSPFWGPAGGGFTSTPRAGAPRSEKGVFWGYPARAGFPDPGTGVAPGGPPGPPGRPSPGPGSPGNRGAPARGVDVKPPRAGSRDPSRGQEPGETPPRGPGRPLGDLWEPLRDPRGPGDLRIRDPDPAPRGGFTSTPPGREFRDPQKALFGVLDPLSPSKWGPGGIPLP